jgi:hypothetical protein
MTDTERNMAKQINYNTTRIDAIFRTLEQMQLTLNVKLETKHDHLILDRAPMTNRTTALLTTRSLAPGHQQPVLQITSESACCTPGTYGPDDIIQCIDMFGPSSYSAKDYVARIWAQGIMANGKYRCDDPLLKRFAGSPKWAD